MRRGSNNSLHGILRSAFGIQDPESSSQDHEEEPNAGAVKFYKLVEDVDQRLYQDARILPSLFLLCDYTT